MCDCYKVDVAAVPAVATVSVESAVPVAARGRVAAALSPAPVPVVVSVVGTNS